MKKNTYIQIRNKYLEFMKNHGHSEIPNAPLIPENDPTLLFISAGMATIIPFLLGEKHPSGSLLTNIQRCIRTIDIEEVGNEHHCTAFEMLGNWSLNDYYKDNAIKLSIKFYTQILGIDIKKIYASAFKGNKNAEQDDESITTWINIFSEYGIDTKVGTGEHIQLYDKDCWWELGNGGPCGPCSEIFIDTGKSKCGKNCHINCTCGKYVEIGNNVFMEYLKKDGKYLPLERHNVDFGGGLERTVMLMQNKTNYYETDIYLPILHRVQDISKKNIIKSQRIIVDHIKSATWIIMDGTIPGRTEQGYILRRLIRRAVRHGRILGIHNNFTHQITEIAIDQFKQIYPELSKKKSEILDIISNEESKFRKTLDNGLKEFEALLAEKNVISGENAFHLYETYGFPIEITQEMAKEKGLTIDLKKYEQAYKSHQKKSRDAAKGFFKGGLADTSDMSKKFHTATHLLLAALTKVLGIPVVQKGSNINPKRLRLDFSNDSKLTPEELKRVEDLVNEQIKKNLAVTYEEMPKSKALKLVPNAAFVQKYGDNVKVYYIGNEKDPFSVEICGGPHVENTSELGKFKIIKHENVGAGIKRIKAILV